MKAVLTLLATPRQRIIALVACANLFAYALIAVSLEDSYLQYSDRAAISSRNTNRLVSQNIADDIQRIDLALKVAGDEIVRQRRDRVKGQEELTDFLTRLQARLAMTNGLRITDGQGAVIAGSGGVPAGINNSDRDYFIKLRDNPQTELAISQPLLARIDKNWVLVFARRLVPIDGVFSGIVYASVPIEWFVQKFINLEVGPHGAVVLRGDASRDFDLLARYPAAGFVGQTKVSETFRATITANPAHGTYQAYAGADNILRTFSYQAVSGFPLITLVGLAPQDYLGPWWVEASKLAALALLFTLLTGLSGLWLLRAWSALQRQTDELARSNADLEQFAYIASHDLQTPLRNIVSFTQLLSRRYGNRLDGDADEFIGYIVDGAKRMSQMITDLFEYARISTVQQEIQSVDLGGVVKGVLAHLAPLIREAEAEIAVGDLPKVLAGDVQMTSLFQNLIENAIHYRNLEGQLKIDILAAPDAKGFWRLSVRDNGIGIAPEYHSKVFIIFQRLYPLEYPSGTGIGLAICRRIVERLGGRIWIKSESGQGSTFLFTLPAAPLNEPLPEMTPVQARS